MPRIARAVITETPHHITQRGNYKQKVFSSAGDYKRYLAWFEEYKRKFDLALLSYCLMPNHVHFVTIPKKKDSLAKTFNSLQMKYAQYFNKKNNVTGHLWQGRFYSCALDEAHLYAAIRYVERNPVRSGLVEKPWDWKWSSAISRINGKKGLLSLGDLSGLIQIDDWRQFLGTQDEKHMIETIRKNSLTGRPAGSEGFIKRLERMLNRRLVALPRGRPKAKNER